VGGERIVDFGLNPPETVLRQLGSLLVSTKDKIHPAALERIEGLGSGVPHQFDELEGELESLRFDYLDGVGREIRTRPATPALEATMVAITPVPAAGLALTS
jgi:hypothetical protein